VNKIHLEAKDYLPIKGVQKAIDRGSMVMGWLGGELKELSLAEINDPGSVVVFYFSDVTGKGWQAFFHMSGGYGEGEFGTRPPSKFDTPSRPVHSATGD
jgi:hypothetical protein